MVIAALVNGSSKRTEVVGDEYHIWRLSRVERHHMRHLKGGKNIEKVVDQVEYGCHLGLVDLINRIQLGTQP